MLQPIPKELSSNANGSMMDSIPISGGDQLPFSDHDYKDSTLKDSQQMSKRYISIE